MLFGNPKTFAVEIFDDGKDLKSRGFGRMCLHLGGYSHGDVSESECSLWHPVERIEEVAQVLPALWSEDFEGHTDQELFAYLDAVLYSGEISGDTELLGAYDFLTNTSESFHNEKSFVFCDPRDNVRIVWQNRNCVFRSVRVPRREFESVVRELSEWFIGVRQARGAGV